MSKTTAINVVLLVISIGLAVAGQLAMKAGMSSVVDKGGDLEMSDFAHPVSLAVRVGRDGPLAVVGIVLYAISAVFWLIVLSRVNLSVAYPMVAVGYVFVVFWSWLVFKEEVRWFSWIGLALIAIGVIITSQGLKSDKNGDSEPALRPTTVQVAAAPGAGEDHTFRDETRIGDNNKL